MIPVELLSLTEFLGGCSFSPLDFASLGLGYLCRSGAPGDGFCTWCTDPGH